MYKVKPTRAFGLIELTVILACQVFISTKTCAAVPQYKSEVPSELIGTWKSVKTKNMDALIDALGAPESEKQYARENNVTVTIERLDNSWKVTTVLGNRTRTVTFPIGIEIKTKGLNGEKKKTVIIEEGERLVEMQKEKSGILKVERYIENGNLVSKQVYNGITAYVKFKRAGTTDKRTV